AGNAPPCDCGTHQRKSPLAPSARTSERQRRSIALWSDPEVQSKRAASSASLRCTGSKNGQSRWAAFIATVPSVAFKLWCLFCDECVVRPPKISRLHADRLRFRFGFDCRLEILRPFAEQHLLGHRMREGRAIGQFLRVCERF